MVWLSGLFPRCPLPRLVRGWQHLCHRPEGTREPGNTRDYVAPDAFVAGGRVPEPPPRVYRTWLLPPLRFAAEIGSVSNTREAMTEKRGRYERHVRPLEPLETEPIDEEVGEVLTPEKLHLYRLTDQGYQEVEREPNGRVRAAELELEIGVDEQANLKNLRSKVTKQSK